MSMKSDQTVTRRQLRIAVTGDTGFDLYTRYVKGYVSSDGRVRAEAAFDVEVPSGAGFIATALGHLLAPKDGADTPAMAAVSHFLPKASQAKAASPFSTVPQFLVNLEDCGKRDNEERLRVKRVTPLEKVTATERQAKQTVFEKLGVEAEGGFAEANFTKAESASDLEFRSTTDLLVVHDGAGSWRQYGKASSSKSSALELVKSVFRRKGNDIRVIVNLTHDLPEVRSSQTDRTAEFSDECPMWKVLLEHKENVCVMLSANLIRRMGGAVSRRLSWEQTIEDLATDLLLFDRLRVLARFRHVVIRFGVVGAVHIATYERKRVAKLYFAPLAKDGIYRDPIEDGQMIGNNVLLTASLARVLADRSTDATADPHEASPERDRTIFDAAIRSGLQACMSAFDNGYYLPPTRPASDVDQQRAGTKLIEKFCESAKKYILRGYETPDPLDPTAYGKTIGMADIPCDLLDRPPGSIVSKRYAWQILRDTLDRTAPLANMAGYESGLVKRINLGIGIVMFGHHFVVNRSFEMIARNDAPDVDAEQHEQGQKLLRELIDILSRPECLTTAEEVPDYTTLPRDKMPVLPVDVPSRGSPPQHHILRPIYAPILEFGNLTVIERQEIESLHSIRNLMKGFLDTPIKTGQPLRPISIAVFGPPGSGKSFAVKQLAKSINDSFRDKSRSLEIVEYNLAQFRSLDELGDAITRISSVNNQGRIPLAFFDEFDCEFDGKALGWLKYFLAPMQDGTFYGARQTIHIGRAIFVFAGGTYASFDDFDPTSDPAGIQRDQTQYDEFLKRKQLFSAQKGPDFISRLRGHINVLPVNSGNGETKPIVRRSLTLRGLIQERQLTFRRQPVEIANIDEDVVYAMLTVDRYRHGSRSMEAILQMCTPIDGRIEKASLPSRAQLNMHVDADEFMIRVYRGRYRPQIIKPSDGDLAVGKPSPDPRRAPDGSGNPSVVPGAPQVPPPQDQGRPGTKDSLEPEGDQAGDADETDGGQRRGDKK